MKPLAYVLLLAALSACNSSTDNEVVGQVKKVVNRTPIVCPNYTEVDVSLGVVRGGVGSMSHDDLTLALDNDETALIRELKEAAENGSIVKLTYDVKRFNPCWPSHRLGSLTVEAVPPK